MLRSSRPPLLSVQCLYHKHQHPPVMIHARAAPVPIARPPIKASIRAPATARSHSVPRRAPAPQRALHNVARPPQPLTAPKRPIKTGPPRRGIATAAAAGASLAPVGIVGAAAGLAALPAVAWLASRYRVSRPDQYLVRTGLGIPDIKISKQGFQWPFQKCDPSVHSCAIDKSVGIPFWRCSPETTRSSCRP